MARLAAEASTRMMLVNCILKKGFVSWTEEDWKRLLFNESVKTVVWWQL